MPTPDPAAIRAAIEAKRDKATAATPSGESPDGWNGSGDLGTGWSAIYGGPTENGYRQGVVFQFAYSEDCDECARPSSEDVAFIIDNDPAFVLGMCDADLELLDFATSPGLYPREQAHLLANLARRYGVAS